MKKPFALAVLALSFSAFADVNPELVAILKKYDSYLMNLKPGMTALSHSEDTELYLDENGEMNSRLVTIESKKVILKVMGTKTYILETSKNLTTGEELASVTLDDHSYTDGDGTEFQNIREENGVLKATFLVEENDGDDFRFKYEGQMSKVLTSPIICDMAVKVNGTYTNVSTQQTTPYSSDSNSICGDDMPLAEMKKLDLSSVEFCDYVKPESETENNCTVQDMSHLIKEL